jgi:hypothetical protein
MASSSGMEPRGFGRTLSHRARDAADRSTIRPDSVGHFATSLQRAKRRRPSRCNGRATSGRFAERRRRSGIAGCARTTVSGGLRVPGNVVRRRVRELTHQTPRRIMLGSPVGHGREVALRKRCGVRGSDRPLLAETTWGRFSRCREWNSTMSCPCEINWFRLRSEADEDQDCMSWQSLLWLARALFAPG